MYSDVASFTFILFYFFLIDLRCVCVCVGRGAFMGATTETATTYVPWSNRWVCAAKRLLLLYERTTERERLRSAPAASAAAILMRPHHTCMNRIYSRDRIHLRFFLHVAPFHPLPSSCWLCCYLPASHTRIHEVVVGQRGLLHHFILSVVRSLERSPCARVRHTTYT